MPMKNRGFTLLEIIVIMLIIGILSAYAVARFQGSEQFAPRGYFDELSAATRYAQRYAVSSGCVVQIDITINSYALTLQDAACGIGTPVQSPTGGNFSGTAPDGVTVTGGNTTHRFDARGDLVQGGGTVTVQGGGNSHSFTITASTGFVDS